MIQGGDNYSDQPAPLGGGGPNSPLTDTGIICGEMTATLVWSDYRTSASARAKSHFDFQARRIIRQFEPRLVQTSDSGDETES